MILGGADVSFDAVFTSLRQRRDVMGMALAVCLRDIEADLHTQGWDCPPRLLIAYRALDILPKTALPTDMQAMAFSFSQVGPPLHGEGYEIAARIEAVAEAISEVFGVDSGGIPDNIFAWALVNEGYTVIEQGTPEERERVREAAETRQLNKHPAAQEIRFIMAVDRSGAAMQIMRVRQSDELALIVEDGDRRVGGGIPHALHKLMSATLGEPELGENSSATNGNHNGGEERS